MKSSLVLILCVVTLAVGAVGASAQGRRKEAKEPADELYPIRKEGKLGYMDRKGAVVIEPQYDDAWEFSEGLAYVKAGNRRGVIDRSGKMVVELTQVDFASPFTEGLASVQTGGTQPRRGFIDKTGKLVIAPQFDSVESFGEGLAVVMIDRKYGFIDKTGKVVIE
ncbi:MAG: WG repeat-containing protein, partial [Acidobacteria bacterium]|nr:WG repeat-containing protein [Acidobacteriota bacterium]